MKILTMSRPATARPALRPAGLSYAVHAAEAGTAILNYTRDRADRIIVGAIERLPAGLDPAVSWLEATFPDLPRTAGAHVTIDADGLGQALWDRLNVGRGRGWTLYEKRGRDRQALVNALLVAQSEDRIHVAPSPHADAMRKALLGYRRTVGDDGAIGAELVVALALAVVGKRPAVARIM